MDIFGGSVWKFGDDIDTDVIIAARYLNTSDPKELSKYIMEDAREGFSKSIKIGDIIVAGENFGCGSSREHAPIALKEAGISAVVAKSFARIFYRNSFNIGLTILQIQEVDNINEGDRLQIDMTNNIIKNQTNNEIYNFNEIPHFMKQLLASNGLINYAKNRLVN